MLERRPTRAGTHTLVEVQWNDPRAARLRRLMDHDTQQRYNPGGARAESPEFVARRARALAVSTSQVVTTLLVLDADGTAVGHVGLRRLGDEFELKRLFVLPAARGSGVARSLLARAEETAWAAGAERVILQTGTKQPEAVALYTSAGYTPIPVYEPYRETMPDSLCFEKHGDDRGPRRG